MSVFERKQLYSLSKNWSTITIEQSSDFFVCHFSIFYLFHTGVSPIKIFWSFFLIVFWFVDISHLLLFIIFSILLLFCTMVREIGSFYKNNQLKLSNPNLKKPVLSTLDSKTSSASNSTQTSISSRLDNKHITIKQNKNKISNTDEINLYVTPQKNVTVFRPHLLSLIWRQ